MTRPLTGLPSMLQRQTWYRYLPWRVHEWIDRHVLESCYSREPGPAWTFRDEVPDATLLFGGDIALHRWKPDDSLDRVFGDVREVFRVADFVALNLETVLSTHEEQSGQTGRFLKASPTSIACLQYLGVDAATVANNHALDFGSTGFSESAGHLRDAGIAVCGVDVPELETGLAGATVQVVNGIRIGMVAATDHLGGRRCPADLSPVLVDSVALAAAVRVLKESCDLVVVQLHWGYEYVMYPLRWHRDVARGLVDVGADIVCCHHAHVVMGVERWNAGIIAHGLGNFWFGSMGKNHPASRFGILLRATVDRRGVVRADVVPVSTGADGAVRADAQCLPGFGRLCAEVQSDRTVDRVEASRLAVEIASLLHDVHLRTVARDIVGLLERQSYLAVPRHDWLLARAEQCGDPELRAAADWLRYFRGAAREEVERSQLAPQPVLSDRESRADGRRLYGRWP
ncbi:MAG: CapA family protein [Gemmatimonadaceae bacterium]|nr:CapA family protein [Gemmatimonadaceae bacterium]